MITIGEVADLVIFIEREFNLTFSDASDIVTDIWNLERPTTISKLEKLVSKYAQRLMNS